METRRFKLISCDVFFREFCHAVARSPHIVDVEFLTKGLHDLGAAPMRERLQAAVDKVGDGYDAILLGYGLCNNGLAGLTARKAPLVLVRAHDCITLFLGSRQRYAEYFVENPGTYFKTSGWIERGENPNELSQLSIQRKNGMDADYAELVAKYGEDNAAFLYETLYAQKTKHYAQFTFIEMGIEPDRRWEKQTEQEADKRGWRYAKAQGDMRLIEKMVGGDWPEEEFIVVPPGHRIVAKYDEGIVDVEPVPEAGEQGG